MCIRDRQYNEALIALPIARKNWEGGQNAKVASPEERQQTLDAFRKIELLLESKEYATLQQLLQKRIEYSKCVCEDYFKNGWNSMLVYTLQPKALLDVRKTSPAGIVFEPGRMYGQAKRI